MSTTSPLSRPVDLVLHVGMRKTGTSSIQFFLRDNRERLLEEGLLVPTSPGGARHTRLGLFVKSPAELAESIEWGRQRQSDPRAFKNAFRRRLFSEIESSDASRLLLTDEILFEVSTPSLRRLVRLTERIARSLRVVVYLRRQDDHLVSHYQQGVKVGWTRRLADWARDDLSGLYDYHAQLRRHERLLSPDTLVVRRFEREAFVDGSLLQDFLVAAGVDARAEDMVRAPDRNTSLDAESVEFLRLLNLYRVEHEGAVPGLIDNRELVARLTETARGPVLTMPSVFLDEFMARWERSNRRVARRFLDDPSGRLFHEPRRSEHTTVEQRLDPARLDHYLALAEVPGHLHEPLRAISEREARSR